MAGGSLRHNALCSRVNAALHAGFGVSCTVLTSDQRVGVAGGERYVNPDLSVVSGAAQLEPGTKDVLLNPKVLIEVLSSSTEQYDRGLKWEGYQRIPSLVDYVLVSQSAPRIEHFRRDVDGSWLYRSVGAGERLALASGATLDVDALFAGVLELPGE